MGGCKCIFRGCKNNTANNPSMHFFHFPVKDRLKLSQWVKYANAESILELDISQVTNKVVCSTHFRDECFMNYKRNRITKAAVPTLVVISEDENGKLALDYEASDFPKPTRIPITRAKHMLPPDFETETKTLKNIKHKLQDNQSEMINSKTPKLQNNIIYLNFDEYKNEQTSVKIRVRESGSMNNDHDDDNSSSKTIDYDLEIENCLNNIEKESYSKITEENNIKTQIVCEKEKVPKILNIQQSQENNNEKIMLEEYQIQELDIDTLEKDNNSLITELKNTIEKITNDSEKKIEALEKLLETKDIELQKLKPNVSQTTLQNKPNTNVASTPLSKNKLFQSIKKYLSPSMSSLVCMEMFGSSDREWTEDEKVVATELLELGESVFCFVRDEWRFRLPPQKDVQQWLQDKNNF